MPDQKPKSKPKQKHRPSALSLDKNSSKMQDIAVDILSPGLNHNNLDSEQKSTIELSNAIKEQQKKLIAAKHSQTDASTSDIENNNNSSSSATTNITTKTTLRAPNTKKRTISTPTIIIEQVSGGNAKAASPLPSAKKFKRDKAPPPLKITPATNTAVTAPSIQTAPIRNNLQAHSYYGNRGDFVNNSRIINQRFGANRRAAPGQLQQQHQQPGASPFVPRFNTSAGAAAAAAAVANAANAGAGVALPSPIASPYFAPRYYPGFPPPSQAGSVATPTALTPSVYHNPYYRSLLLRNSQLNTPRNPNFAAANGGAGGFIYPQIVPGAPMAANIPTPTAAINGSAIPITPLNYAFQAHPILTGSENYVINRHEASSLSELNKAAIKNAQIPRDLNENSRDGSNTATTNINKSANVSIDRKNKPAALNTAATTAIAGKETSQADDSAAPRKTLQSPLTSNIVKQTISTQKRKPNGEPKTPIHLQKSNTPHVTDVFPGEMTKFAPVSNQPLSARDEHFDFNLYKEEPSKRGVNDGKPGRRRNSSSLNKSITEEEEDDDDDDDDVESKAIEEDSKLNVELEVDHKIIKTGNLDSFKDFKVELRLKNEYAHKLTRFKFEENKKARGLNEKKEFLKHCEQIWDEFAASKKKFEEGERKAKKSKDVVDSKSKNGTKTA